MIILIMFQLMIEAITEDDAGMYTCMVASLTGQNIEKTERVVNIEVAMQADVQFADDWKSHLIMDQVTSGKVLKSQL